MSGHILVIDDDAIALELTQIRLESAGFRVSTRQSALGTGAAVTDLRAELNHART